jgi:hypothetical protein
MSHTRYIIDDKLGEGTYSTYVGELLIANYTFNISEGTVTVHSTDSIDGMDIKDVENDIKDLDAFIVILKDNLQWNFYTEDPNPLGTRLRVRFNPTNSTFRVRVYDINEDWQYIRDSNFDYATETMDTEARVEFTISNRLFLEYIKYLKSWVNWVTHRESTFKLT